MFEQQKKKPIIFVVKLGREQYIISDRYKRTAGENRLNAKIYLEQRFSYNVVGILKVLIDTYVDIDVMSTG